MRTVSNLAILCLGITVCAGAAAEPIPVCVSGLTAKSTVPPRWPPRLHNEFSGRVLVSFVISPAGKVLSPAIVTSEWHPVGRSAGQPVGYNEAILTAVARWQYPLRKEACRHQVPIEIKFEDSSASAGPSRSSFQPTPLRAWINSNLGTAR